MNSYRYKNRPCEVFLIDPKILDKEKFIPWRIVPPSWKNSSTKEGRSVKIIKKDRKRNKKR